MGMGVLASKFFRRETKVGGGIYVQLFLELGSVGLSCKLFVRVSVFLPRRPLDVHCIVEVDCTLRAHKAQFWWQKGRGISGRRHVSDRRFTEQETIQKCGA